VMEPMREYRLKDGMQLGVGDRHFTIRIRRPRGALPFQASDLADQSESGPL
jgi:hypothetical protein